MELKAVSHKNLALTIVRSFSLLFIIFAGAAHSSGASGQFPEGYIVSGYDLVSYFESENPMPGDPKYTATYKGENYAFSSQEHKALFEASPERFLPEYSAYCAYGMANGMQLSVDPAVWEIVDDRLFFLINSATEANWKLDVDANIRKSDKIWQKLSAAEHE